MGVCALISTIGNGRGHFQGSAPEEPFHDTWYALAMTVEELQRALARRQDVTPDDVRAALADENPSVRQLGAIALYRTRLRQAADALGDVCLQHAYVDRGAIALLEQLSALSENPLPMLIARKYLGLQALASGDSRAGIAQIEGAVIDANHLASRGDARSRQAMRFFHDAEIEHAYDVAGSTIAGVATVPAAGSGLRVAVIVSTLIDNAATTTMAIAMIEGLRARGYLVDVYSTAHTASGNSWAVERLSALRVPFWTSPLGDPMERTARLIAQVAANPVHAALFYTWPMDAVGKLASVAGLARAHVLINSTSEQRSGRFDAIVQYARDFSRSFRPALGRYAPPSSAAFDRVEQAAPLDRSRVGVDIDRLLIGTYGRMSKCVEPIYVDALTQILRSVPEAVLVIPGLPDPVSEGALRASFGAAGLLDRVRFPGFLRDEYFSLLKTTDLYCDTFSWTGGQSILDAMVAGLPIVASKPAMDPDFDPTGTSAISLGSTYLSPDVPVANASDPQGYVDIAVAYLRSPALRRADGERNRLQAQGYTMDAYSDALDAIVYEAIARYEPVPSRTLTSA